MWNVENSWKHLDGRCQSDFTAKYLFNVFFFCIKSEINQSRAGASDLHGSSIDAYHTDLVTQAAALRRWRTSKKNISSIDIFNVWQRSNPRGCRANGQILSVARTQRFSPNLSIMCFWTTPLPPETNVRRRMRDNVINCDIIKVGDNSQPVTLSHD